MPQKKIRNTKYEIPWVGLLFIGLTLLFFWQILLTNLILVSTDTFLYFYPYKHYAAEALREGRLPLWNPHLFMGVPFFANSQVGVLYPLNWPLIWLSAPKQVAWSIGLHIALAGIGMTLLARRGLGLNRWASLTSGIVFAFGGYLGGQVEHINQLNGMAWLPWLFWVYQTSQKATLRQNIALTLKLSVIIALTLLAGHTQTVFINLFGLGLYALWQSIEQVLRPFGETQSGRNWGVWLFPRFLQSSIAILFQQLLPIGLASIGAVLLSAVQILPTAELSSLSIRQSGLTFQEVVSFSLDPRTLHYSLLPPYGVDLSHTMRIQAAFSEWVAYMGIIGLGLAIIGGWQAMRSPQGRPFLFVLGSSLLLSFGVYLGPLYLFNTYIGIDSNLVHILSRLTHPYYLLYRLVPGFDLFRVPARWLLLYSFSAAVLTGYGMAWLTQAKSSPQGFSNLFGLTKIYTLPLLALFGLILWHTPPLITLLSWIGLAILTLFLLRPNPRLARFQPALIVLVLLGELFIASQALNYNQPTAPQAFHSWRNAIAYLQSVAPQPPDRFLSLSGVVYDPGDLADLTAIFQDSLSQAGLDKLIVATKQKEVLFFNLPMVYGFHSVDGYDGGILPLSSFINLQKLFLAEDNLSIDGRLREKLQFVPPVDLLSLLNTRWIITDKQFDVWIDGIFYDLQFPARLSARQTVYTREIPAFPATAIGVVSHLEGGDSIEQDTVVGNVRITFSDGHIQTFSLRVGQETASGVYSDATQHQQTTVGVSWPHGAQGVSYIAVLPISTTRQVGQISQITQVELLAARDTVGKLVVRGLSLIHQPSNTSRSLLLSTEGDYQLVHSGDVKIYENRAVLPRAYLVPQAEVVDDLPAVIDRLQQANFEPQRHFVTIDPTALAWGSSEPLSGTATIIDYQPEQVMLQVTSAADGWLILTDTDYPGWQATVSGQSVEIMTANLMFRAIPIPAGTHEVVFTFDPSSFQTGLWMSGLGWVGVLLGLLGLKGMKRAALQSDKQ